MIAVAAAGFFGVLVGALIVTIAFNLRIRYDEKKEQKRRTLEHKVKEIETLNQLNKKINEILQKRSVLMEEYVSFDAFDDCYITIDDYAYLQSFAAQNNFYLPNYILEEFFKNIAQRKVILSPDETIKVGGYAYKGGRVIMEHFSDDLTELINERKTELKRLSDSTLTYFSA
ncbi:hypothetical protein JZO76_10890 [Enterococcus sp. MJM12]|uniref:Uncharacterized protein n=1 Tax=Candidatus Enterococcus myersii TaxID=2815322 RepID=A0ABS3H998_9ENTE|nr:MULTISPECIES: hypothetical protein [Enterococcus]MBO0450028.1 hypothetical protein [Enterococcus sp. MJM12]MCD1025755.1 hypothetical protein [Enterococcus sp. SMC-9]MDT2740769.1 hypothetical protein [Enterococcus canintestini]WHA08615.1 hypothetical protein P3T75_09850 [Enterococcus montenegrensis]